MTNAHFFGNLRPRTWLPWEQSCNTPIKCKHRRCACGSSVRSRWDTCNLRFAPPRSARYRTRTFRSTSYLHWMEMNWLKNSLSLFYCLILYWNWKVSRLLFGIQVLRHVVTIIAEIFLRRLVLLEKTRVFSSVFVHLF